ncbi:MAG: N-6 DNA methylase [Phycisphaerales bacterium]|jgi:predicted helicase|nr:N-6 DNA methylase [Phycisphaerales bacterium]
MADPIKTYLTEVQKTLAKGDATEHTYRPALKTLVESMQKGILATNEPKRIKCGAPDFIITDTDDIPLGYIECKDIGKSLVEVARSPQLKRYFDSLDNIILTDYLEFRHYISGELQKKVTLAEPDAKNRLKLLAGEDDQLRMLFGNFLSAAIQPIHTPSELAKRMANIAKVICDAINKAFNLEDETGTLHDELESFRSTILHELTAEEFADMYAQTVCYGMFSARVDVPDQDADSFSRQSAAHNIPKTNPFLREMFNYLAGPNLDDSIVWAVDLLVEILRRSDMNTILKDFGKGTRRDDPVVHFYETFLKEYDKETRKKRGVYYTPQPVVDYIVRSVDHILKTEFSLDDGLADNSKVKIKVKDMTKKSGERVQPVHRVQVLDPATGTGTFLYSTMKHIHESMVAKGQGGLWAGTHGYVAEDLLPRLYGFELMMAPYAVAHLKLGMFLRETGYDFASSERLRVFLTNTLEEAEIIPDRQLLFAGKIAQEANSAASVKTDSPVMVVLGNPPYSGESANTGQWSKDLIRNKLPGRSGAPGYFECDGKPLDEKNPKWINNDYAKFIRFGQARVEQTGYGVLAFITDHGYIDNPTFRGMRQSLMRTFDDIYILDLHGNPDKMKIAPDGTKNDNVFDITQGVSICVMVKKEKGCATTLATVHHGHLYGRRKDKFSFLSNHEVANTQWTTLQPDAPFYLFVPQNIEVREEYNKYWKVTEIFPTNGVGLTTARDHVVIDFKDKPIVERASFFRNCKDSNKALCEQLGIPMKKGWDIPKARAWIQKVKDVKDCLVDITYRPFDNRRIFYHDSLVWRTVKKVMRHMLAGENQGLISARSNKSTSMDHFFCTRKIMETKCGERTTQSCLFPLYLYPEKTDMGIVWPQSPWEEEGEKCGRVPNLSKKFVDAFSAAVGLGFVSDGCGDLKSTFGPEDIFHYVYAVFHSPRYRERYAEFLKIDFPRLPLPASAAEFARLAGLGAELVGLHLLEAAVDTSAVKYPIPGDNIIRRKGTKNSPMFVPATDEHPARVYINDTQYFEGVSEAVWNFHVGGYQVCQKWLKYRFERELRIDDIETYQKIVISLGETIRIMAAIDGE